MDMWVATDQEREAPVEDLVLAMAGRRDALDEMSSDVLFQVRAKIGAV